MTIYGYNTWVILPYMGVYLMVRGGRKAGLRVRIRVRPGSGSVSGCRMTVRWVSYGYHMGVGWISDGVLDGVRPGSASIPGSSE